MIVSRPQTSSFISLVLFLLIAGTLIAINVLSILNDPQPPWFNYLVILVLTPVAAFILYKVFFRYKIIRMGNGEIAIAHPQFGNKRSYRLNEIASWKETIIKTGKSSMFKELEIRFSDGRSITMGHREYTGYELMTGYLVKKLKSKQVASPS